MVGIGPDKLRIYLWIYLQLYVLNLKLFFFVFAVAVFQPNTFDIGEFNKYFFVKLHIF